MTNWNAHSNNFEELDTLEASTVFFVSTPINSGVLAEQTIDEESVMQ